MLLRIDRKFTLRPGRLFAVYLVGYSIGRFWIEGLRIDPAHHAGGLRLNQWVSLIVGGLALVYLLVDWQRHRDDLAPVLDDNLDDDPDDESDDDPEASTSEESEEGPGERRDETLDEDAPEPEADQPDLRESLD